ncbi:hypothetical protein M758_8G039300 [Ceratodon purpureus]|nr:hypothetical protein M758_8G039300 [Ceratodon purpureus]
MATSSGSFKGSISEAGSSMPGSMRSPLSSFMRSPISNSMMPSPVSSRLTMEFETAFLMEAEEPVRFSSTDILPYLSQPSSRSVSSSDFDSQSDESRSTSFCDFNDSNRITLGSLIGLPMDSFRHFGESFRFRMRGESQDFDSAGGSMRTADESPRRSRTCSLLGDLFRCLQRTKTDYLQPTVSDGRNPTNLTSLTSFTITEVSEEEERDSDSDVGPTVFDNSVFVERDTLGSRIYEFNPLYISDAMSDVDSTDSRSLSLSGDHRQATCGESNINVKKITNPTDSGAVEMPRLTVQVNSNASPICRSQPLSPMRAVLTTVCCQLGDDSDEYTSD